MRSGVRVDPGGEEREGHDDVRPVTSGFAGVQIDRSGPRGFGMAAVGQCCRSVAGSPWSAMGRLPASQC